MDGFTHDEHQESEHHWFRTAFTAEELEGQFQDQSVSETRREHAFYRYWCERLEEQGSLSREELKRLLEFPQWNHAIGDIIQKLCRANTLGAEDARWLLGVLAAQTFAHNQVRALCSLRDRNLDWEAKLTLLLESRADWAVERLLATLPFEHVDKACGIITGSQRPKRSRRRLLDMLRQRTGATEDAL
jgi:hypothetical protein